MDKQYINLIGGCFQHDISSTDSTEPQFMRWLKNSNEAPITIYVDHSISYEIIDKTKQNYGWICESRTIIGNCYDWARNNIKLLRERFITVFTHDADLAKSSDIFTLTQCSVKSIIKEPALYSKTKLVSMIASGKIMCQEHAYRQQMIKKFSTWSTKYHKCDHFGRGINPLDNKIDGLKDYCFSIAMENATYPNMITEKLTDCFATGTIPIYYGIENIGDFFNNEGIIKLDNNFNINDLSFDLYYSKLGAVIDNFKRSQEILLAEDYIYKNFIKNRF